MFYDKEIELWKKGITIKNSIGQMTSAKSVLIQKMMVDMQPYSSEEAKKEYGFTIACTKRMFCDIEEININSYIIKYNNKDYDVVKIIPWDDYLEVVLNGK